MSINISWFLIVKNKALFSPFQKKNINNHHTQFANYRTV